MYAENSNLPVFDFLLQSEDPLTRLVWDHSITTWHELVVYVRNLPFGQISNQEDLSLIIRESKGSCSTKHAFLRKIALLHGMDQIRLYVGIYQRTAENNPDILPILKKYKLEQLPEAHCYLRINDHWLDVTTSRSMIENKPEDFTGETEITSESVPSFKKAFYLNYLRKWIEEKQIPYTPEDVWKIREETRNQANEHPSAFR